MLSYSRWSLNAGSMTIYEGMLYRTVVSKSSCSLDTGGLINTGLLYNGLYDRLRTFHDLKPESTVVHVVGLMALKT